MLLDGVDVRELAASDLRRHVGVVLQEPFLFRGTICDNLVYGRPDATAEEAITAARAAQAHDFILRSPLGYDTWLGERGAGLSGGEKQRVSIARALLYDPKVLILDEATSSVDTESEKAIQEALRVLTRGRTTLAIAHRLSTLRDSDRILVFDEGRLIEQGSHRELMRLDGQYARLVKIQTQIARNQQFEMALNGTADIVIDEPEIEPTADRRRSTKRTLLRSGSSPTPPSFARVLMNHSRSRCPTAVCTAASFAVRCFPASRPDDFISLRMWDRDGQERELGIVRRLGQWSARSQELIRAALARRYFLRRITRIDDIKLEYGHLLFDVSTDQGPCRFTMRWTQSQAQDFGARGKVLSDLEDNRFLVPDVDELPPRERRALATIRVLVRHVLAFAVSAAHLEIE